MPLLGSDRLSALKPRSLEALPYNGSTNGIFLVLEKGICSSIVQRAPGKMLLSFDLMKNCFSVIVVKKKMQERSRSQSGGNEERTHQCNLAVWYYLGVLVSFGAKSSKVSMDGWFELLTGNGTNVW